jgi:hypothetical protein
MTNWFLLLPLLTFHAAWLDYCHRQVATWPTETACLADEPDCWHRAVPGEWIIAMGAPLMPHVMTCKYHTLPKFITGEK